MKALTVQQPWAWAIIHGGKDVENRTQVWSYRGPLAIHAGQRISKRGLNTVPDIVAAESLLLGADLARDAMLAGSKVLGAIIGVVDLVDVHTAVVYGTRTSVAELDCCESPWAETGYTEHGGRQRRDIVHLVLENPRPLSEPIPCRGALGLWNLPPELLRDVVESQVLTA